MMNFIENKIKENKNEKEINEIFNNNVIIESY